MLSKFVDRVIFQSIEHSFLDDQLVSRRTVGSPGREARTISAGANVKAVQRMLGHASAAMTLDTYADLFDDDLDYVADALCQARRGATAPLDH